MEREEREEPQTELEADQPSTATSSGEESEESSDPLSEYFVRHKLTKMDTLAGLAVRYNVTVSDIKRANGLLADTAMFAKETLLIPTRPLPVGPEYSVWAGMIVTHYGRLGPSDDVVAPSDSPYAHFSQTRAMQQLRGYYSTGPSRSQSPQYGSGTEDGDRHHLFARGGGGGDWGSAAGQPQQVELMERSGRSTFAAAATYIEDRLRRRGRSDSQVDDSGVGGPSSSGEGGGSGSGSGFALFHRQPLFSASSSAAAQQHAAALASAGGRQLREWKETLLQKLKKVASQPALAVPPGSSPGMAQVGAAAVASSPLVAGTSVSPEGARQGGGLRQRPSGGAKAD